MKVREYLENHWIKNKIWTHDKWPKHQLRLKMCAAFLEGKKFIDVGCCLGHSTHYMKKFFPGEWSGLEFWEEAVIKAQKLFSDITFYYSSDFNLLPICGKFDGVVCSETMEHVEYDKELLKSLINITKKVLVMTTPNLYINDPGHLRVYTEESLAELFKGFNYTIHSIGTFFYIVIKNE